MSMLSKLKQFKDLREQGKKMESMMSQESVTVRAAGDKVVLTMDGTFKITGLAIDDEMMGKEQKDKLIVAIKDAHEDAKKKIQRTLAMKMQQSGEFNLPGMK
ncbi:MAG TPA: YbaB/EbfC family nucleoid-associated protein [Patescibacteria group bacterium]|nr:YbaB/EbfC family nucleoid-associated protein [Patescibacteria group bacterium]